MYQVNYSTAFLIEGKHCKDCGWPIVCTLVNGPLAETEPYKSFDTWDYCTNLTCWNHKGEGTYDDSSSFARFNVCEDRQNLIKINKNSGV